jgi:hypothetical protein
LLLDVSDIEVVATALLPSTGPTPFQYQWLPAVLVNPMLFHTSVFVCMASFETLAQKGLSATSFEHRGKALQLINASLSNATLQQSDEIIAAILALANFEVSCLESSTVYPESNIR